MKRPPFSLNPFRRLQWRLTLSYTLVTVAALVVVELFALGLFIFLFNSGFLTGVLVQTAADNIVPQAREFLEQTPPDLEGLNQWTKSLVSDPLAESQGTLRLSRGLTVNFDEGWQIYILDAEQQILSLAPNPAGPPPGNESFNLALIPQLSDLLPAALASSTDLDQLYTTDADGNLVMALPIEGTDGGILGLFVMTTIIPTLSLGTLQPFLFLIFLSAIVFALAAGLVGAIFGNLTARGLTGRLGALSQSADAWSRGDFSVAATDTSADELGQLAHRLNLMAEQLQNLLQTRQELAALEERNRLARELHDSVKQNVFATAMQIGAASALLPDEPEAALSRLAEAEKLARQSQRELTGMIEELRPAALDGTGLVEALTTYVDAWSRRTEIRAQLRVQGERPAPLAVEQALFRVAQEALSNVARHSQAQQVELYLRWQADDILLSIVDDGQGFDQAGTAGQGFGLQSMKERLVAMGGQLQIVSQIGAGTQVKAQLRAGEPAIEEAQHV